MHLLGDFPSPLLIGVLNQYLGMQIGMFVTFSWLYMGSVAWFLAYNTGVIFRQRFMGKLTFWEACANICKDSPKESLFLLETRNQYDSQKLSLEEDIDYKGSNDSN